MSRDWEYESGVYGVGFASSNETRDMIPQIASL